MEGIWLLVYKVYSQCALVFALSKRFEGLLVLRSRVVCMRRCYKFGFAALRQCQRLIQRPELREQNPAISLGKAGEKKDPDTYLIIPKLPSRSYIF